MVNICSAAFPASQVKHAAEGDVGAAMQDAARMAQAGARGAAQTARLVFEQASWQTAVV